MSSSDAKGPEDQVKGPTSCLFLPSDCRFTAGTREKPPAAAPTPQRAQPWALPLRGSSSLRHQPHLPGAQPASHCGLSIHATIRVGTYKQKLQVPNQRQRAWPICTQLVSQTAFRSGSHLRSRPVPWRHQAYLWPVRPPAPHTSEWGLPGAQRWSSSAWKVHNHRTWGLGHGRHPFGYSCPLTIPAGEPRHTGPELHPSMQSLRFWLRTQSNTSQLL